MPARYVRGTSTTKVRKTPKKSVAPVATVSSITGAKAYKPTRGSAASALAPPPAPVKVRRAVAKGVRRARKQKKREFVSDIRQSLREDADVDESQRKFLDKRLDRVGDRLWRDAKKESGLTGPPPKVRVGKGNYASGKKQVELLPSVAADYFGIQATRKKVPGSKLNAQRTLLHEFAHIGQARSGRFPEHREGYYKDSPKLADKAEGRADRFSRKLTRKLKLGTKKSRKRYGYPALYTYPKWAKESEQRDRGKKILHGQFEKRGHRVRKRAKGASAAPLSPQERRYVRPTQRAQKKTGVPASILMALTGAESTFGQNKGPSSAGAMGDTQFMPATRDYILEKHGVDAYAGKKQAEEAAALYLKELGVKRDPAQALAAYNAGPGNVEAGAGYAQDVLGAAAKYAGLDRGVRAKAQKPLPKKTVSRFEAIVDEAKKIDSAQLPYSWGGGHVEGKIPGPKKIAYDCSGVTSRVLQQAGYDIPAMVSGQFATWGKPGEGAVTIYANEGHVFMKLGNRYFGTSSANPSGGAGFIPKSVGESEASGGTYAVRHAPGLGKQIARRMGVRIASSPGLSYSASGTTATITDGAIVTSPGASEKPIKVDPKTLRRRKAKKAAGRERSALIRKLIAEGPAVSPTISAPSEAELAAEEVALGL